MISESPSKERPTRSRTDDQRDEQSGRKRRSQSLVRFRRLDLKKYFVFLIE